MKKIFIQLLAFTFITTNLLAQLTPVKVEKGRNGMFPTFIEFAKDAAPAYNKGSVYLPGNLQQRSSNIPVIVRSEKDLIGGEHTSYQQTFNNIPIEGAIYITHASNGKLRSQNGKWIENFPTEVATIASISKEAALRAAMEDFGARTYKWQLKEEEQFIKRESNNSSATFYPKAELVYYTGEEEIIPENIKLAYKLDVYANEPIGRRIYFIDARTGEVLGKRELIHTTDATGTATTAYSGNQTISTDLSSGTYRLREIAGRGNGIQTLNLKKGTNYNTATDFTDADNSWNNVNANLDQYATDAHWGAEKTYDFYKTSFGRNSIDGKGFALKNYVHYSTNYFNAFWDGSRMTYGDGNSSDNYKPLTALDVAGHEITHGLTTFTANLNYSNESGAMNEAFSDIFGTAIEAYARPSQNDWLIGGDFYPLRSMSNPNTYGDPDTYKGTYWYSGTADNGGVHTNSGVLNYWFYLLSAGGNGTNDLGTAYNVTGIGIQKAAAIAFRTLTVYLISTSKYADARTASIKAAQDLYGTGSAEVTQTTNAWIAVGVGEVVPPPACTDVYESNETRTASKSISTNTDITAKIGSTTDIDWFTFTTTTAAPNIRISLSNLPKDYDLKLYNSAGTQLRISQNGGTTAETITYNTSAAGVYYIQVYGYSRAYSTTLCYLLRANVSGAAFFGNTVDAGITSIKDVPATKGLAIYPNPVRDVLSLNFEAETGMQKDIVVIDIMGRIVFKKPLTAQRGINTVKLNLPGLTPGIYFLKVGDNKVQRFEIAR